MRTLTSFLRRALPAGSFAALGLAAAIGLGPNPALADRIRDRVQADAFGNLVVWSSSGYKRIVVGRGDLAEEMNAYAGGPKVVYGSDRDTGYDDDGDDDLRYDHRRRYHSGFFHHGGGSYEGCYRPPVFVKGRGYMYGLADGEMPELASCLPYNSFGD